jgi:carboxymethylenebutenolidase
MPQRWEQVTVDGSPMGCFLAAPEGAGPFPGVLVVQHAPGVDEFIQEICQRLAGEGYVAIAPELYHRETEEQRQDDPLTRMGRLRDAEIARDVDAAVERLRSLPEVDGERVGIVGFCMGGRVALMMAALNPAFKACVDFYGGNIMVAWGEGPAPIDLVPQLRCPVLGLFGAEDTNPSPQDVARLDQEMTRHGKPHQFHSYPGAGHAFLNRFRPTYRPEAAADAWRKCLDFLARHLRRGA